MKHLKIFEDYSSQEYIKQKKTYETALKELKGEIEKNKKDLKHVDYNPPGEGGTRSNLQIYFGEEPGEGARYDNRPYVEVINGNDKGVPYHLYLRNEILSKDNSAERIIAYAIRILKDKTRRKI